MERRSFSRVMEDKENKENKEHSDFTDCRNHFDRMGHMEQNVWEALHMFRKLNIGSILPHLNKGEFVLMNGIYHVQKKIGSEQGGKDVGTGRIYSCVAAGCIP